MRSVFGLKKLKGQDVRKRWKSTDSLIYKKNRRSEIFEILKIPPNSNAPFVNEKANSKLVIKKNGICMSPDRKIYVSSSKNQKFRINAFNIQMISESLHKQIFGDSLGSKQTNRELLKAAKKKLKVHGLLKDKIQHCEDVSLNLPPLKGKNIEEHFQIIGEEQCKPYRELVSTFIKNGLPKPPSRWLCQKGWTKYVNGEEPVSVPFPNEDVFIFDVETAVRLGELPTLATAVSSDAWYGWVSSDLYEGIDLIPASWYNTSKLIPFEGKSVNKERPRIIIGYNVSYDRARVKEQYYLKHSALRFLDVMSLHICIGGITKTQKTSLKNKMLEEESDIGKELCLCTLKELYKLYCNKELEKEQRNLFLEGLMPEIRNDFQNLMEYCSKDVMATYEVLQAVFPVFLHRCPHPVTFAGMLEMGSPFLPVNANWNKFLSETDQTYEDLKGELSSILSKKCNNACKLFHEEKYKQDLWMWNEDWTTQDLKLTKKQLKPMLLDSNYEKLKEGKGEKEEDDLVEKELLLKFQYLFDLGTLLPKKLPFLPGYPSWYRKLVPRPNSLNSDLGPQLSTSMLITPKLLNLTWENFPLYHTQEFGWGILLPDISAENVETSIPFEKLKELTIKNCKIDLNEFDKKRKKLLKLKKNNKENSPVFYYKGSAIWCNLLVDDCCYFFKMPHKNGCSNNVGNPLSKDIVHTFNSGVLSSQDFEATEVLDLGHKLTYWRNSRQRIIGQMVVWLNKKEFPIHSGYDEDVSVGVILPKVVICGTLTRRAVEPTWLTASKVIQNRIGSELRSMIQAPPGYHFVGADVDSQELWIASLIGDSYFAKEHGCTPLGWMTLSGTKSSDTDMHSLTAKAIGISRDDAKVLNYARIYGAGVQLAQKLLKHSNPSLGSEEALSKAYKMYELTKGKKEYPLKEPYRTMFMGKNVRIYDLSSAMRFAERLKKRTEDVFEKPAWVDGTESAMFNQLEKIAKSSKPVTPFLKCRLSRALEPRFEGDDLHLKTRFNWVVQSGAVDFLHLMLVCMKWLTNGKARYCFSFHDEVRYLIPTEERYSGALALHITNLLVRSFCAHRLGIYDLPQSVAFFSSVEIDKTLRKEANDDCVTPSNPHGIEKGYAIPPGESLNIYQTIEKSGGSLFFEAGKKRGIVLSCLEKKLPS